jgi:tetratricopeptide (TPR) repeat protein
MRHEALSALIGTRSFAETRRVLSAHRDLLDPAVDAELVGRLAAARVAGDLGAAHAIERARSVLRRCRDVGVQTAFHELTDGAAERYLALRDTAQMAGQQYSATGDVDALNRMVEAHSYLVYHPGTLVADRPVQAAIYNNAAVAYLRRFNHFAGAEGDGDIQRAAELSLAGANLAEAASRDEAAALDNHGRALYRRFQHSGSPTDLDEAIKVHRQIAGRGRDAVPGWIRVADDLAAELLDRYALAGDIADLDRAIRVDMAALESVVAGTRPDVDTLKRLGISLRTRHLRTADPADLDAAVNIHRTAVAVALPSRPQHDLLNSLGGSLAVRFRLVGNPADLDEAITVLGRAVAKSPHPEPVLLMNHAAALQMRYEATGDDDGLEAAVDAVRDAVTAAPASFRDRAGLLADLGALLRDRFERSEDLASLREALDAHLAALAGTRPDSPVYPNRLNAYARTLDSRHRRTGGPGDLAAAVDAYRGALEATPADRPEHAQYAANLGAMLSTRARVTGQLADFDAAVDMLQAAVAATPAGAHERADRLENLANALSGRARRGREADLDRAIVAYQEAATLRHARSPKRPVTMLNLGNALRGRYERGADSRDIDAAVTAHRDALSALDRSSRYGVALGALAGDLFVRFGKPGHGADLDEAIRYARAALASLPPQAPDRVGVDSLLATALWIRAIGSRDDIDAAAAAEHSRAAARQGLAGLPEAAVIAGFNWSHMASRLGRWDEAAEGGEAALRGLQTLVSSQLIRPHQESWLTALGGVAADTAYAHAARSRGEAAVLALEQGRSLLLAEVLERDRGLRALAAAGRTDLSDRLQHAAGRLQQARSEALVQPTPLIRSPSRESNMSAGADWTVSAPPTG